jgi:hypothetical protein
MADKPGFKPKPGAKPSGGGGGDNFWGIIAVIIFVAIAINRTGWGSRLLGTATSTPAIVDSNGKAISGKTYSDPEWGITFAVPDGWKVNKIGYRSPAQEAAGDPSTVVQVDIVGPNKSVISMGGRQTECSDFAGTDTSCRTVLDTPVYTSAKDADSRAAFDLVTKTMRYK